MNNKNKLIYLAGIVDGEGHFCRPRNKNGQGRTFKQSRLIVENLSKNLIYWIKENFGGGVDMHFRDRVKHPTWQDIYRWTISGKKCEELAVRLQPYLIVKKEQVKRVLPEFYKV